MVKYQWIATCSICQLWLIREDKSINCTNNNLVLIRISTFNNRVCDIWNSLPNFAVEASSSDNFRRLLNQVDLFEFVVLQWLCVYSLLCIIFLFSLCWVYISGWYSPLRPVIMFIKLCLPAPYALFTIDSLVTLIEVLARVYVKAHYCYRPVCLSVSCCLDPHLNGSTYLNTLFFTH